MIRVPPAVGILFTVIAGYVLWSAYGRKAIGDAAGGELVTAIVGLLLLYLLATNANAASGFLADIPRALGSLFAPTPAGRAGGPD